MTRVNHTSADIEQWEREWPDKPRGWEDSEARLRLLEIINAAQAVRKPAGYEPCSWPECGCQNSPTPIRTEHVEWAEADYRNARDCMYGILCHGESGYPNRSEFDNAFQHAVGILSLTAKRCANEPQASAVTDAMVEAAAREMWNDRDARMGGPWEGRSPGEICVVQTKATARAALVAALGVRDEPQTVSHPVGLEDAIRTAETMLSQHIEEFHDFDYEPHQVPLELQQLRNIQHHLLGTLVEIAEAKEAPPVQSCSDSCTGTVDRADLAKRVETTPVDGKFGTRLFAMSDAERDLVVRLLRSDGGAQPTGMRESLIEQCAKIAEPWSGFMTGDKMGAMDRTVVEVRQEIAAAIRSLVAQPPAAPVELDALVENITPENRHEEVRAQAASPLRALQIAADELRGMKVAAARINLFGALHEAYGAAEVTVRQLAEKIEKGEEV